jgi:hypothetical protein
MSVELKARLDKIVQENCERQDAETELDIHRAKELLLKVHQMQKFDFLLFMQGTKVENALDEKIFGQLERANLVEGETKYTDHNVYRQYQLTLKGAEVTKQIVAENSGQTKILASPT